MTGLSSVRRGPALLKTTSALSKGNKVSACLVEAGGGRAQRRACLEIQSSVGVSLLLSRENQGASNAVQATPHK